MGDLIEFLGADACQRNFDLLIRLLSEGERYDRKCAAFALLRWYREGKLDEAQKNTLLQQREMITSGHTDKSNHHVDNAEIKKHIDIPDKCYSGDHQDLPASPHADTSGHFDKGGLDISFDFERNNTMPLFGPPNIDKMKANCDIPGLVKATTYQKDHIIRLHALDALDELDWEQAKPAAINALHDEDYHVQSVAIEILVKMQAVEPLLQALHDPLVSPLILARLEFPRPTDGMNLPISILATSNNPGRLVAAKALGNFARVDAAQALVNVLGDPDPDIVKQAVVSLQKQGDAAQYPLLNALKNPDENIRARAVRCLAALPAETSASAFADMLTSEPSAMVREQIASTIAKQKQAEIASQVEFLARCGNWSDCIQMGADAVVPLLALLGKSVVRDDLLIEALGKIGDKRAVAALTSFLKDKPSVIISAAAKALGRIKDAWAVPALIESLKQKDVLLLCLKEVVIALGEIGDPRAIQPLLDVFNNSYTAREHIAPVLVKFYRSGALTEEQKTGILQVKDQITSQRHTDYHDDGDCPKGHMDYGVDIFEL